ncbi:MAG: hypothetical protein KDC23_01500 [Actinobacteria bacterium]|nr:hypothetical protein [Actinomycetota bacterium]
MSDLTGTNSERLRDHSDAELDAVVQRALDAKFTDRPSVVQEARRTLSARDRHALLARAWRDREVAAALKGLWDPE